MPQGEPDTEVTRIEPSRVTTVNEDGHTSANMVEAAARINSTSWITFTVTNGSCTSLAVINDSTDIHWASAPAAVWSDPMSSASKWGILGCGLGLAVGVAGMWVYGAGRAPRTTKTVSAATSEVSRSESAPRTVILGPVKAELGEDEKAALRALIREELEAGRTPARGVEEAGAPDPDTLLRDLPPAQLKTYDVARSLVDQAMLSR
jgi:hypothetical protein